MTFGFRCYSDINLFYTSIWDAVLLTFLLAFECFIVHNVTCVYCFKVKLLLLYFQKIQCVYENSNFDLLC